MERKNRFGGLSIGSSISGFIKTITKQRSWRKNLPFMVAVSLVAAALSPVAVFAAQGALYTTDDSCAIQNGNVTYQTGDTVWLKGVNFNNQISYVWWVNEVGGGENVIDQGNVPPVVGGEFCFGAHLILPPESGEYKANIGQSFYDKDKSDNYQVDQVLPPETWTVSGFKWNDLNGDGIWDQGEPGLLDWTINLDVGSNQSVDQTTTTNSDGYYEFTSLDNGPYTVSETQQDGWSQTFPEGGSYNLTIDDQSAGNLNFGNYQIPEEPTDLTIVARKIVCDSEADLPNWGEGGPDINADTAQDWVAQHPGCHFVEGWNFQWGPQDAYDPGDTLVGPADPPWQTFGPTDVNGTTTATLTANDIGENSYLWFREILQQGYIPFTFDQNNDTNVDNVSAELYCHVDVLNYDNRDRIDGIQLGQTYNCVGFNVLAQSEIPTWTISGFKWNDLNGDHEWPQGEPGLAGWTIYLDLNNNNQLDQGEPSTITGQDGSYSFPGLSDGDYTVREVQQDNWTQTWPMNEEQEYDLTVDGADIPNQDFGNQLHQGSISGKKIHDHNSDGVQQEGDEGLGQWNIYIDMNQNGVLDGGDISTFTAGDGSYSFPGLGAGTYIVREVVQGGWTQVWPNPPAYSLAIGGDNWDWPNINFGNITNIEGQGNPGGGGGGGGGGGTYTPPTTPSNEEVRGEQGTPSNEGTGGEQTLPVTGTSPVVVLLIALAAMVSLRELRHFSQ